MATAKKVNEIKFSQVWGKKYENDEFTTIRGQDALYELQLYPIYVKGDRKGSAVVTDIRFKRIKDFTVAEIVRDLGMSIDNTTHSGFLETEIRAKFMNILKAWYQKKSWWMGQNTVMQILYLKKVKKE